MQLEIEKMYEVKTPFGFLNMVYKGEKWVNADNIGKIKTKKVFLFSAYIGYQEEAKFFGFDNLDNLEITREIVPNRDLN